MYVWEHVLENIFCENLKVLCFWNFISHFFWQVPTNGNHALCFVCSLFSPSLCHCPYIYTYKCMYESMFWKIFFARIWKCCVFEISSRTFSGRYQLMETMLCVLFVLSSLPPCATVRIYIRINVCMRACFGKYFLREFESAVFLKFHLALFLAGTN